MIVNIELLKEPEVLIRDFTHDDLSELKKDIYQRGLKEAITVDQNFTIVSGVRRFRAMKEMGWSYIPCRYLQEWEVKVAMLMMEKPCHGT